MAFQFGANHCSDKLLRGISWSILIFNFGKCFVPAKQIASPLSENIFVLMFVLYVGCCDAD